MYKKDFNLNGFVFTQEMDLSTDTAYYKTEDGTLLMEVDSSGNATDGEGNLIGRFRLTPEEGRRLGERWRYVNADTTQVIDTPYQHLFDDAEPYVFEKLFNPKHKTAGATA